MREIIYDCEVFSHDWIVDFKDTESGIHTWIHNDNQAVIDCLDSDNVYIGFNSKHYDQFIIKAICAEFEPEEIKKVNDFIIGGGRGWECSLLDGIWFSFNNVDIRDDTQAGLSLKAIEGHLGMDIRETDVPFDLDRQLSSDELRQVIEYCKHDVDATHELVKLRRNYLDNKINIGKLAGLSPVKAMGMTNAKLTAALLQANPVMYKDEREYIYPDNLKKEYVPKEVFEFFDRMYNPEISDKDLFDGKLNIQIGDCPVTIGYGGIHGALPHYFWSAS